MLMEKPMTTDVAEAAALRDASQASPCFFAVNNTASWRAQAGGLRALGRAFPPDKLATASSRYAAAVSAGGL